MRVWFIDPGYLDNKRLNGAHTELHALFRIILNNGRGWSYIAKPLANSLLYVVQVHDLTVLEMCSRQFVEQRIEHSSVLSLQGITPERYAVNYEVTEKQRIKDVKDLRKKWEREGYYYGTGRLDLRLREEEYGLPSGPSLAECEVRQKITRQLVKVNSSWFKGRKGKLGARIETFYRENPFSAQFHGYAYPEVYFD